MDFLMISNNYHQGNDWKHFLPKTSSSAASAVRSDISHAFPDLKPELLDGLAKAQLGLLADKQQPLVLAAYREEGQAGHGKVEIEEGAMIQGYVADMPEDFDVQAGQTTTRSCKPINEDGTTGEPAIVCIGSDNQIPEKGDVDFIASDGEWYKVRTGTAIISKDPDTGAQSVEPKGLDFGLPYGVYPGFDWDSDKTIFDNLSQNGNTVHKADESPFPWNTPPKSLQPTQYLHRLNQEEGLGPLPVPPPPAKVGE